jgi:hypothetical protein
MQERVSLRRASPAAVVGTPTRWVAKPPQRKLRIGVVDDPLEREADWIAERVAQTSDRRSHGSSTSGDLALRRKCACGGSSEGMGECEECKKKRETALQRSPTQAKGPGVVPAVVHDVLNSSGKPLGSRERAFFEPAFGHDFSHIRIHTDERAAESARSVNALAYTVGRDIVFDTGRYAPCTKNGRKLLAHELTHTVQQSSDEVIRRVPPTPTPLPPTVPAAGPSDFQILRVEGSTTAEIFFTKNSSTLTPDAKTQIASIKSSPPSSVKLFGFSSADETASVAQTRANQVKSELAKSPGAVSVTSAVGSATAQAGQADFPRVRKVEIVVGSAAPTTLNCQAKDAAGNLIHPPKQPCSTMDPASQTAFNSALTIANDAMNRATAAVASTPNSADAAVIDQFFNNHDPGTLATLKTNLGNLKTHVAGLPGITSCGGQCDSGKCDSGSVIAYNSGVDAASTMTLCVPTFKSLANDNDRARNLMHESAHGTSPLGGAAGTGTRDVAYRHERIIFQLSTADRLRNSDSYALFALFLRERQMTGSPAAVPAGIETPATDTITGFSSPELSAVKAAVAKLEKRLTWAKTWMGQLYGQIVSIRGGASTWATSWADNLMTEASKRFPFTAPPAAPKLEDQTREAGILDRYIRMQSAVKRDLTITRMGSGVVTWPAGGSLLAAASLQIGPDFFTATPDDQISLLLQSLAGSTPDVETAFIPAYVSLAAWIHSQNP